MCSKYEPIYRKHEVRRAEAKKQKALEPHVRHCKIEDKEVHILIEYVDYKNPYDKGEEGAIYCENILDCYQRGIKCRYSGISPLYPDPFKEEEEEASEEEWDQSRDEEFGPEDDW